VLGSGIAEYLEGFGKTKLTLPYFSASWAAFADHAPVKDHFKNCCISRKNIPQLKGFFFVFFLFLFKLFLTYIFIVSRKF